MLNILSILNGENVLLVELFVRSQESRIDELKEVPQLAEVVLHGCSRED